MSKKTNKAPTLNAKQRDLIASAAAVGYGVMGGFASGIALAKAIGNKSKQALVDAGLQYKAGYIVRYLEDVPGYAKRVGNMSQAMRFEDALSIYAKPAPTTAKPNRRTDLEHKACRAADVSWHGCKARAGLIVKVARKPRPASAGLSKNAQLAKVPVDLVKASPKLTTKVAANDYFATAAAALLATVDKNAKHIAPQLSSAVSDFKAAVTAYLAK
jgi:hypothetical protein